MSLVHAPHHDVQYKGDPLADLALMSFLDKLAYKQKKKLKAEGARGGVSAYLLRIIIPSGTSLT